MKTINRVSDTAAAARNRKETAIAREIIRTDKAPQPVGPYSQAVKVDGWVYCAGQIPLDPATGRLVEGDAAAAAERVLLNLQAVLEAAGGTLSDTVKVTVYLRNLSDFKAMNAVFERFFPADPPARAALQAARLPADARVEMDLVARVEGSE